MTNAEQRDQVEIKPSFSIRYIGLATFVALLPAAIGGVVGWAANEYFRDRRVIEVTSTSSTNLTPIADSVAGNLEVLYRLSDQQKEPISSLFKYDVTLANMSSEGVADLSIIVIPPKDIQLVAGDPTIATDPPGAVNAIRLQTDSAEGAKRVFTLNLLNTRQKISLSLYGFSRNGTNQTSPAVGVVAQKKDWTQRNVDNPSLDAQLGKFFTKPLSSLTVAHLFALALLAPMLFWFSRVYLRLAIEVAISMTSLVFGSSRRQQSLMRRLFE